MAGNDNDFIEDLCKDNAAKVGGGAIIATIIPSIATSLGVAGGAVVHAGVILSTLVASAPIVLIGGGVLLSWGIFNTIRKRKVK